MCQQLFGSILNCILNSEKITVIEISAKKRNTFVCKYEFRILCTWKVSYERKVWFFSFEFLGLFDTGTWVQLIFMIPWIMSDRMNVINWLRCNRTHFDVLSNETYLTTSVNGLNSIIFFEWVWIHHLLRMSFYGWDGYEVLWRSGRAREQLGLDPESAPNFDCRSPRWTVLNSSSAKLAWAHIEKYPSHIAFQLALIRITLPSDQVRSSRFVNSMQKIVINTAGSTNLP